MDDVQEVKSRVDIVQLVGETVQLKKAGRSFKGLCPFHNEKTPSFIVTPDRGTYHCFGCGEGGDIFEFVMKRDSLDFPEALKMLASRAGVTLTERNPKEAKKKQRLQDANAKAADYFQAALQHDAGQAAREYLKSRGLTSATVKEFRIGYAPDSFDAVVKALKSKGFNDQEIIDAGLAGMGGRGIYARFRHRLMIPITDTSGVTRGFTGRLLDDNAKEAKYVNTSETPVFHKGKLVFALHQAKQPIITSDYAVLVEGQMDVISAHQAGTNNVVAASGTALTEDQLKQITRYAKTLVLALDNDAAGRKAMMRAVELIGDRDIELKIADLGEAKDPDDLIQEDPQAWRKVLEQAKPVIEYLMDKALADHERPYSRDAITLILNSVLPALKFRSDLDQDYYLEQLAQALGVGKDSIKAKMASPTTAVADKQTGVRLRNKRPEELVTERLLGLVFTTEPLKPKLAALDIRIFSDAYRSLAETLQKGYNEQTVSDTDRALLGVCTQAAAEYEPMIESERAAEFDRLLARLKLLWGKQHQPKLLAAIKRAEERGDTDRRNRLMQEYTSLTKRILHGKR